jgi:hypothetical protein
MKLQHFATVDFVVTKLCRISLAGASVMSQNGRDRKEKEHLNGSSTSTTAITSHRTSPLSDLLVCIGHFNGFRVFRNRTLLLHEKTPTWVHAVECGDIDGDGNVELVLAMIDNRLLIYRLSLSTR